MSSGEDDDLVAVLAFLDGYAANERPEDGATGSSLAVSVGGPLDFLARLDMAPGTGATLEHESILDQDTDAVRADAAQVDTSTSAFLATDLKPMHTGSGSARRAGNRRATSKRKRPPAYNSNHARQEQHKELLALRAQEQVLQRTLAVLQASQHQHARSTACQYGQYHEAGVGIGSGDVSTDTTASTRGNTKRPEMQQAAAREDAVWQEIANRQVEQRMAAESEQRRLKRMLETQKKLIAELQNLVFYKTTAKVGVRVHDVDILVILTDQAGVCNLCRQWIH